jgi:hypothetical protein
MFLFRSRCRLFSPIDTKGSVAAATTLHKKANRPETHCYIVTCCKIAFV